MFAMDILFALIRRIHVYTLKLDHFSRLNHDTSEVSQVCFLTVKKGSQEQLGATLGIVFVPKRIFFFVESSKSSSEGISPYGCLLHEAWWHSLLSCVSLTIFWKAGKRGESLYKCGVMGLKPYHNISKAIIWFIEYHSAVKIH